MINFLIECNYCSDNALFSIIYLVKKILEIVFILVPIILIVLVLIDIAKNVVAGKEDDMKKNQNIAIKRIIYAVAIFLVPAIVNVFMNVLYRTINGSSEQSFLSCWEHANLDNVKACNEQALANEKQKDDEKKQKSDQILSDYQSKVEENKKNHQPGLTKKSDSDNESTSTDAGNLPTLTDEQKANANIIWVGDSRTEGMCKTVTISGNENCIAKVGVGLAWLKQSDTQNQLSSALANKTDAYVIINLGVNSISGLSKDSVSKTASTYVDYYKELANKYSNAHFIITSVGTVDEAKEAKYNYHVTNANVNSFNIAIENALKDTNIKYCNINNTIRTDYVTGSDGLHYTGDTYKKIYDASKKCF